MSYHDPFFDYKPKWLVRIVYYFLAVLFGIFFTSLFFHAIGEEQEFNENIRESRCVANAEFKDGDWHWDNYCEGAGQ